jgi:hypothetical protein
MVAVDAVRADPLRPRLRNLSFGLGAGSRRIPPRRHTAKAFRNKLVNAASFFSMPKFRPHTRRKNVNVDEGHYLTMAWAYLRMMYVL